MKTNAMNTGISKILGIFVALLLFAGSSVLAQGTVQPDAVHDPYAGMTIPEDFVMPTDPSIGVLVQDGSEVGIYKKIPPQAVVRPTGEILPPTVPEERENTIPSVGVFYVTYFTLPSGDEGSVKVIVDNGRMDSFPQFDGDENNPDDVVAFMEDVEAWNEANPE